MVRTAPLAAFANRFEATGFSERAFVASYGMAEATLALTMAPLGRGPRQDRLAVEPHDLGSRGLVRCGPPLPEHELQVRDETGAVLAERRVGHVFVRGPSLMQGYYAQPEATRAVLDADGWLDTGDLGFLAEGEFVPTGRSKDLILLNGRNIWPQDLEWTVEAEVVGLRSGDAAAFGADGEGDGVVVLVQTRVRDADARERLVADVAGLLRARHGVEAQVRLVSAGALPQTSSGKLRRSQARDLYRVGAFEPA